MQHILDQIPNEIDICAGRFSLNDLDTKYPKIHPVLSAHPTLQDFIYYKYLDVSELQYMTVYGVIRDPVDRFLSITHFMEARQNQTQNSGMSHDEVVEKYIKLFGKVPFLAPQSNWLLYNKTPINRILKYPNFNQLFDEIGISSNLTYQHYNQFREDKSVSLDSRLRNQILDIYRIDVRLMNSLS